MHLGEGTRAAETSEWFLSRMAPKMSLHIIRVVREVSTTEADVGIGLVRSIDKLALLGVNEKGFGEPREHVVAMSTHNL